MNYEELQHFQTKLKIYNFKYDEEILERITKYHTLENCMKAYESIVRNSSKLTGLNIINELEDELKAFKAKRIEQDNFYKYCALCENSGLISLIDQEGRDWAFCCKCGVGGKLAERSGIPQWNGIEPYKFQHQTKINGRKSGEPIEIIAKLNDRYKERIGG